MALNHDKEIPPDLADRVEQAVEAMWRGDSAPFERLLDSEGDSDTDVAGALRDALAEHARPAAGLPGGACIRGYEVISELGRGGMGVVYKALQLSTKRIVALKVMLAGPFASQQGRRRFQREVELTARFQHSGIVRVLEGGEVSTGQPYYTMDYVEGIPLDRWLSLADPDVRAVVGLFRELCSVAEHAHKQGVIHRDLKPANVLIDAEGKPHVLDFGLAKESAGIDGAGHSTVSVSTPGQVIGTLRYSSPEQAEGGLGETDARADVYALGVMLFEALTGSLPIDDSGAPSDVARRILEEPPASPSSLSPRVDGELETIVLKALAKDKALRYQSAEEFARDLGRYLTGEPILARRPSSVYRLRKKLAQHRAVLPVAVAGLILALAAVWTVKRLERRKLERDRASVLSSVHWLYGRDAERALDAVGTVLAQHPDLTEAVLVRAHAQYSMAAQERDEEWSGKAIRTLRDRLDRDPSQWAYRFLLAEIFERMGNPQWRALRDRADREVPDTAEAAYIRSFATLDLRKAKRFAQTAVERSPGHILARRHLADLCVQTADFEGAREAARDALRYGNDRSRWATFQGDVLMRQGHYADAVRHYTERVKLRPSDHGSYWARAHAYVCLQEYDKAIKDYTRSLELDERDPSGYWQRYFRASALWMSGQREKAAADYRAFRTLRGRVTYAEARLFLVLHEQSRNLQGEGRGDEARRCLHEARDVLQAGRRGAAPGSWLGKVFACLAGVLAPDELVAAADPTHVEQVCESYYYAGEVCLLSGEAEQARRWFRACVGTDLVFDSDVAPAPMNEYHLALWRLKLLPADAPETSDNSP